MMQLMVCTLMDMSNIAQLITAKVRKHLIGSRSGSGSSDESIELGGEFINKAHYVMSVAFVAGGTAAVSDGSGSGGGSGGELRRRHLRNLAIAVAWGMGYEMSLEWFKKTGGARSAPTPKPQRRSAPRSSSKRVWDQKQKGLRASSKNSLWSTRSVCTTQSSKSRSTT